MSTDIDALRLGPLQGEGSPRQEYLFSAMSWLSVVVISCWMGWLLGMGCGVSRIQEQRAPSELSAPRAPMSGGASAFVEAQLEDHSQAAHDESPRPGVEGSLVEAAQALSEVGDAPVSLAPEADAVAHCVTLELPTPDEAADARERSLRDAIEAAGFSFVRHEGGEGGLQIRPTRDVVFLGCRPKRAGPLPTAAEIEELERSVRQISRREREIPREVFMKLGLLSRSAPDQERVVPYYRDGEMLGVKVYASDERGLPWLLGLEDGDVITHVAGQTIAAPSSPIRLSSDQDKFVIRVLRSGALIELHYKLVEASRSKAIE